VLESFSRFVAGMSALSVAGRFKGSMVGVLGGVGGEWGRVDGDIFICGDAGWEVLRRR
jgi:hypothetical protein